MTTIFSPRINWESGYTVKLSYNTDIWRSRSGVEQRRMIRQIPRRQDSFAVMPQFAKESGLLDALLYGGPGIEWAVPFWPHETDLETAAAASDTALAVDTSDREFAVGGKAILWRGEIETELVDISGVTGSSLTVSPLAGDWPAGTVVMPARLASMVAQGSVARRSPVAGEMQVIFDIADMVDPAISTASLSVFSSMNPNRRDDPTDQVARAIRRWETPSYNWQDTMRETTPVYRYPVSLFLDSKALVNLANTWFHSHRGRFRAFWMPSFNVDVGLAENAAASATELTISFMRYTELMFPFESRRHIAIINLDGTIQHLRVTGSVDNDENPASGPRTETLTLSAGVNRALDKTDIISFMRYVRFADDTMEIFWHHPKVAESTWDLVEIPKEAPTST